MRKKDIALSLAGAVGLGCAAAAADTLAVSLGMQGTARSFLIGMALAGGPFFALSIVMAKHAEHLEKKLGELEMEVAQIEPLLALSRLIDAPVPLPSMREYAIAPDFARILFELVRERGPKTIVETGSGVSTLICAYALEKNGGEGRVLALDHDAKFAARTREMLARHGLSHRATVEHAPLEDTSVLGRSYKWYAQRALAGVGPIDMVIDDGPPKYAGPMARYASLHVLSPKMSEDALFVLDCGGTEEPEIIARWCAETPYEASWLPTKKGNVILRRRSDRPR